MGGDGTRCAQLRIFRRNERPVVLWMQKASGAQEDGKFGPDTLAAVKNADPMRFVLRFVAYRLRYLRNLHTWPTFSRGWTERMATNLLLGAA